MKPGSRVIVMWKRCWLTRLWRWFLPRYVTIAMISKRGKVLSRDRMKVGKGYYVQKHGFRLDMGLLNGLLLVLSFKDNESLKNFCLGQGKGRK